MRRWGVVAIAVAVAVAIGLVIWWVVLQMHSMSKPLKRSVQEIALVKPPPPPPPPPPKVEPPKVDQPKMDVPQKMDTPKDASPDKAEAPPAGPDLGVDANGTGAGDSFGLVGKKGAAGLIGGGGGGNRFGWYGALIRDRIQEALQKDKKLRDIGDLRILVNVWVGSNGSLTRVELLSSSGNADLDNAIKTNLKALPPLREGAPAEMPQPVKLKISAR
jgi:protein TonB